MGKARRFYGRNVARDERLDKALSRQSNTLRSASITPPSSTRSVASNDFLKTTGGLMFGTQGYTADNYDISSGILDLEQNPAGDAVNPKKYINLDPETGSTDTLDLITAGGKELPQQEMVLIGQTGITITITHDSGSAAGNNRAILCPGGVNYTLDSTDAVMMFYDYALSKWRVEGDANAGGGGGASFPLQYTINDQGSKGTPDSPLDHALNSANSHKLKFTITGDLTLAFSGIPAPGTAIDWYVEVTQDMVGGHVITWPAAVTPDPNLSTTAETTSLVALHTDDNGATIRAVALLNAAPTSGNFATKELNNLGITSINASLLFDTTATYNIGSDAVRLANVYSGTLHVGDSTDPGTITGTATRMTYDTNDISMHHEFEVANVAKLTIGDTQITALDDISLNGNNLESFAALNGVNSGSIDSLAGGLEYDVDNLDSHVFKVNAGTARLTIDATDVTLGSAQTLDMNGNEMDNWFKLNGAGTGQGLTSVTGTGITFDVASGDVYDFKIATASALKIQSGGALNWTTAGIEHVLTAGATSMEFALDQTTDSFILEFGDTNKKTTFTNNTISTTSNTGLYFFESIYDDAMPVDDTVHALYQWNYTNFTAGTIEPHTELAMRTTDVTDSTEDAQFEFSVMNAGTLTKVLTVAGTTLDLHGINIDNAASINIASPTNITGSTGGNVALQNLLTELESLGLITDGTT